MAKFDASHRAVAASLRAAEVGHPDTGKDHKAGIDQMPRPVLLGRADQPIPALKGAGHPLKQQAAQDPPSMMKYFI